MQTTQISHLRTLEPEAIHVVRETAAEVERPALLYSGGKDSIGAVDLYNGRIHKGAHARFFPISNRTEFDVWQYVAEESLEVPSICIAYAREVYSRQGMPYAVSPYVPTSDGEQPFVASARHRTVGDMSCTRAVESDVVKLSQVAAEIAATDLTERSQNRADRVTEAAMADRSGRDTSE